MSYTVTQTESVPVEHFKGGANLTEGNPEGDAGHLALILERFRADIAGVNALLSSMGSSTDGLFAKKIAKAEYDFATDGGAIGAIEIGPDLPDNAVVTRAYYKVLTTLTSATDAAEVGLGFATDDVAGIKAGVAISNGANPWDAGWHEGIQDGAAANFSEQLTAARKVQVEIATEAVTAGKFVLFMEYVVLD